VEEKLHKGAPDAYRWKIALVLALGVLINYFDRINLSVALGDLQTRFGLSTVEAGYLLSAYSWTYVVLQLPAGMLLDRYGVRRVGAVSVLLWCLASLSSGFAQTMAMLIGARLLLGIAEAPTFPGNAKAIAAWFPQHERGLPTALFDSAAKFASAIGIPLIAIAVHGYGWRASFYVTGAASFAYFLLFVRAYREPSKPLPERLKTPASPPISIRRLLQNRKVIGLALGMAAYNYNFYLFLTWLPSYLQHSLHLDVLHAGRLGSIPWFAATVSDLIVGGWLVDRLIRSGRDGTRVRQAVLATGLVLALSIIGATRTTHLGFVIVWISLALAGLAAAAPVFWSIPGLIAPPGSAATVGSIMNFAGNISAVLAPIITGYLVGGTQSFTRAFLAAAAILILGMISLFLLMGRIEPIEPSSRRRPAPIEAPLLD
jgi:ACS family D-galactonate transporter-like MFS transporter